MRRKLLLATTNKGKFKEIQFGLESLPFVECVGLSDLGFAIEAPEESEGTILGNAILKAKYYGDKSGLLTLADDTGLFIKKLMGWPGVDSAVIADSDEDRIALVLERMRKIKDKSAEFRSAFVLYDPTKQTTFVVEGSKVGKILDKVIDVKHTYMRFGYTRIFYVPEARKRYAEMDIKEKNAISHRGKCIQEVRYHLQNTLGAKHIMVPIACIIRSGKILMSLRNDPHNPAFHKKWEFPGGCVEFKESIEENLIREVKEEVGYDIEPLQRLSYIHVRSREAETHQYQVYLLPYVCKIIGGKKQHTNSETLDSRWFALDEVLYFELLADNREIFSKITDELKSVITAHNL